MNNGMKQYVVKLLDSYQERIRKIALLHYELDHPVNVTEDEMIDAMNFTRHEGSGRLEGNIPNKTSHIALNYREKSKQFNIETISEISAQLMDLEQEQAKLEYYISLLDHRQEHVLRQTYFEKNSQEKIAEELGLSVRRIQDIKAQAINDLTEMYSFTAKLH